jgi:hypothetical protein
MALLMGRKNGLPHKAENLNQDGRKVLRLREAFIEKTKAELGIKAIGRKAMGTDGVYELREGDVSYNPDFGGENSGLRLENSYFWNLSISISITLLGSTPNRPETHPNPIRTWSDPEPRTNAINSTIKISGGYRPSVGLACYTLP